MFVFHQRVDYALVNIYRGEAVAAEHQRHFVAACQRHRALLRNDHAFVAHLGCQQCNKAAYGRFQLTLVDHAAFAAVAAETGFAGHEVVIADAVRGDHQPADIDLGCRPKDDATGVDQKHLTGGVDAPHDLAGVAADHAVECD